MPTYRYKVLSETGMVITGESLSSSKEELIGELEAHGYRVQYISPYKTWTLPWKSTSITQIQFSLFVNELLSLLKAGLPVTEALELTSDRQGEPALEKIIRSALKAVRAGSTLSEAFLMHKEKIDGLFISVLYTGEKSGNLPVVLEQYLVYLSSRVRLSKKLKQAMAYPIFLLLTLLSILGVMFFFVMPRFASMYANFGAKLPAPTQMLMDATSHIPFIMGLIVVLIIWGTVIYRAMAARPAFRQIIDKIMLSVPLAGGIYQLFMITRVARSLAILTSSGTPLIDSLRTIRESITNVVYAARLKNVEDAILGGNSLTKAMSQTDLMPKTAIKLIRAGEASGNLGAMLSEVAEYYHDVLNLRLERIMALIEPIFIMVMGLIVGAVIIIMYLPIFKLAEVV